MSRLYLIRHGQTTSNEIHALDTALPGANLTELGVRQAATAGARLARRSPELVLVSSQAARAQQTAAGMAATLQSHGARLHSARPGTDFATHYATARGQGLSDFSDATALRTAGTLSEHLATLEGISEIPAGEMEMNNDEDSHERYHGILGAWLHGELDIAVPGGLTGRQVIGRYVPQVLAAAVAAQRLGVDAAVVSHGAVIRLASAWLAGVDPEFAFLGYLANTQAVTLELPAEMLGQGEELQGALRVHEWGEHGTPPLRENK